MSAGLTVLSTAPTFQSPLRKRLTIHKNIVKKGDRAVSILRMIPARSAIDQHGLDANAVIVIKHDNVTRTNTALVATPPARQPGDPLHYDSFLHRICDRYTQRWA